jgi:hypothetical protein
MLSDEYLVPFSASKQYVDGKSLARYTLPAAYTADEYEGYPTDIFQRTSPVSALNAEAKDPKH